MKTSMRREKVAYVESCAGHHATAAGFRDWIKDRCATEPDLFPYDKLRDDAATKEWQRGDPPGEEDLFSVAGVLIPRILTVYAHTGFTDPSDDEFEKVSSNYATVYDYLDNARIKRHQAALSGAAADKLMDNFDIILKKAGGNMMARLKDLK